MSIPDIISAAAGHYGLTGAQLSLPRGSRLKARAKALAARLLVAAAGLVASEVSFLLKMDRATCRKALRTKPAKQQEQFEKPVWDAVLKSVCGKGGSR